MTTVVAPEPPVVNIHIKLLLMRLTRDFTFREKIRPNFRYTLPEAMRIWCVGGMVYEIPAGSELVVYRDPSVRYDKRKSLATFHHPSGQVQTVIKTDGTGRQQVLSAWGSCDSLLRNRGSSSYVGDFHGRYVDVE